MSKLESGYKSSRKAAIDAMSEISGAIVSITLIMAAVFIPVTFVTGSAGVFYKQFGITLAIAIMISAVNALTLCPALAAMFLKPPDHGQTIKRKQFCNVFSVGFNAAYLALTTKYALSVNFLSAKKWIVILSICLFGVASIY
jgi:HAE1 family hydrophobic/amphiphilic exporter-1